MFPRIPLEMIAGPMGSANIEDFSHVSDTIGNVRIM